MMSKGYSSKIKLMLGYKITANYLYSALLLLRLHSALSTQHSALSFLALSTIFLSTIFPPH